VLLLVIWIHHWGGRDDAVIWNPPLFTRNCGGGWEGGKSESRQGIISCNAKHSSLACCAEVTWRLHLFLHGRTRGWPDLGLPRKCQASAKRPRAAQGRLLWSLQIDCQGQSWVYVPRAVRFPSRWGLSTHRVELGQQSGCNSERFDFDEHYSYADINSEFRGPMRQTSDPNTRPKRRTFHDIPFQICPPPSENRPWPFQSVHKLHRPKHSLRPAPRRQACVPLGFPAQKRHCVKQCKSRHVTTSHVFRNPFVNKMEVAAKADHAFG